MAKQRVASLTSECTTMRATLQEQEDHLRAKKKECEVLRMNLAKETEWGVSSKQDCRDQLHAAEFVKAEELRAKKKRIAEDLHAQIAATKTEQVELRGRIVKLTDDRDKELHRADELTASLASVLRKQAVKMIEWAKKLADCVAARSLEVKCKIRFESDCDRLQEQLKL
ncbi:hypothetical protein AXG93_909s1020 [Marchantia polymorpha subsp. ruderalis]|uniref:Uncharacterized protein n=1 Tax=Marchantia polymorpha subsp. ruderalis TaxID=1480154 RepID=A0A176VFW7_MARPO|nr:hypothetical protein AXG93_909s1020 [Marchantia polymorpha subsp. ruderalis]